MEEEKENCAVPEKKEEGAARAGCFAGCCFWLYAPLWWLYSYIPPCLPCRGLLSMAINI